MAELSQEFKDLENYFRLVRYRDETDYILSEEDEELQEIIKRSTRAQEIEDARCKMIYKIITEEEYKAIEDKHYSDLVEAYKERDSEDEQKMETRKNWEEYTSEEKTSLLDHWFHYYGGVLLTLKDMEDFRKLSSTRQDDIFDHIVTSYIYRNTIQSNVLVAHMRAEKVDDLFKSSLTEAMITEEENKETLREVRKIISDELLNTFISPEPAVPMEILITVKGPKKSKNRNREGKRPNIEE